MVLIPSSSLQLTWTFCRRGYIIIWHPPTSCKCHNLHSIQPLDSQGSPLLFSTGCTCFLHWCISAFDSLAGSEVNMQQYYIKQSDGEVPVMLDLWGIRSTPSLLLLPGALWPKMVAPDCSNITDYFSTLKITTPRCRNTHTHCPFRIKLPRLKQARIKKQTEDTSWQKAQQTNSIKKSNKTLSFYRISRKNLSGK